MLGCVDCAPADLAVVQIQSGLHCLSLRPHNSRIAQKCLWITSMLLAVWGHLELGSGTRCKAEEPHLLCLNRGIKERTRCMDTTRVYPEINTLPKMKQRDNTSEGGMGFASARNKETFQTDLFSSPGLVWVSNSNNKDKDKPQGGFAT